jgi:hypothetical protein
MNATDTEVRGLILSRKAWIIFKWAVTAILAAVLDVLKIPKTFRFANSNACLLVMPPDHRMEIPNSFAY